MGIRIILFGRLADIAGNSIFINDVTDTDTVIAILHNTYPALAEAKYVIAINKQVITSNTLLNENTVVALLPPFSGG